jgi:mersacidin/lichenicidin family type 2 lantibiotic
MSNEDIIRAWKDEDYWNSLSEEQRSQLPENPAGILELSAQEMEIIQGGGCESTYNCGGGGGGAGGGGGGTLGLTCDPMGQCKEN